MLQVDPILEPEPLTQWTPFSDIRIAITGERDIAHNLPMGQVLPQPVRP